MTDGDHLEGVDSFEIASVAGVHRKFVRQGDCSDHDVVRPSGWRATKSAKGGGHGPEGASGSGIEGQRFEVRLCRLQMRLSSCTVRVGGGDQGTH